MKEQWLYRGGDALYERDQSVHTHRPLSIRCGGDIMIGFLDQHGFFLLFFSKIEIYWNRIKKPIGRTSGIQTSDLRAKSLSITHAGQSCADTSGQFQHPTRFYVDVILHLMQILC